MPSPELLIILLFLGVAVASLLSGFPVAFGLGGAGLLLLAVLVGLSAPCHRVFLASSSTDFRRAAPISFTSASCSSCRMSSSERPRSSPVDNARPDSDFFFPPRGLSRFDPVPRLPFAANAGSAVLAPVSATPPPLSPGGGPPSELPPLLREALPLAAGGVSPENRGSKPSPFEPPPK